MNAAAALAAVAVVLVTAAAPAVSSPATADPQPTPAPGSATTPGERRQSVEITLGSLEPKAPQPKGRVVVTGRVRNTTKVAITDAQVRLRINHEPVSTRDELAQFAASPSEGFNSQVVATLPTPISLAAGASAGFRLDVAVDDLRLPIPWRVYKLGLDVLGNGPAGYDVLGRLRTFLPYAPSSVHEEPLEMAWVWPLVDRPHRTASGWRDDALAPELARGGRLDAILQAATHPQPAPGQQRVPVTFVVDPLLLQDVHDMADGYDVPSAGGGTHPGTGRADATRWLNDLHDAVRSQPVYSLPYADPDLVSAAHNGLAEDVRAAMSINTGDITAAPLIWPAAGLADEESLAAIGVGDQPLLLSDTAVPLTRDPGYTPSAHVSVDVAGRPVTALLSDTRLSATVVAGTGTATGRRVAEQQFLADTLMIVAERPFTRRQVVVAPNREWRPTAGYAATLLTDSAHVPWLRLTDLARVTTGPVSSADREGLAYPKQARAAELPDGYLQAVGALRADLAAFAPVLPTGNETVRGLDRALLRAESTSWRGNVDAASSYLAAVRADLDATKGKIRIASGRGSLITLTSRSGRIPVTVANDLKVPVRVVLQLNAQSRLAIAGNGRVETTVPPEQQVQIEVRATARTSGVFPLDVALFSPTGGAIGPSVRLLVRPTVYGTLALGITTVAAAILFLAVLIRLTRRALRARSTKP